MPPNERKSKRSAGRWSYRQCLQSSSFEGIGSFLSVVPPMLHTGGNFVCIVFCYSFYRLIEQSKLESRVERIIRQTDGGNDNVTWVTHALHYTLVHEGAFNQINWIRLKPGQSQNKQDRVFSLCKSIVYPKRGMGPGCKSPLESEAMLSEGLKNMNGGCEMLWQLANFDFSAWLDGCVSEDFKYY
eukprot:2699149-Pleurochrysis_carterae.AAC.1